MWGNPKKALEKAAGLTHLHNLEKHADESIKFSILVDCPPFFPKTKGFIVILPFFRISGDFPSFRVLGVFPPFRDSVLGFEVFFNRSTIASF